jgi:NADP-dependent 3-hydroxy acid dehydrogenase YdfG
MQREGARHHALAELKEAGLMKGLGRPEGKVAIVTGRGSGIGAGISRVFAQEGAAVGRGRS